MMDKEKLISEVFSRKPSSSEYSKRDLVRKLWDEVATAMNINRDAVKKRWKNLKDNYRVELRKVTEKSKSGSGTSSIKYTKWALFEAMDFLRNVMGTGPQEGCLSQSTSITEINEPQNITSETVILDENVNCEAEDANIRQSETVNQNINFSRNSKERKRKRDPSENIFAEIKKEKLKILREDSEFRKDDNYNFLISFLPHMKSMSELANLKFRTQITKILLEIKEEDMQQRNFQTPAPSTSWESSHSSFDEHGIIETFQEY